MYDFDRAAGCDLGTSLCERITLNRISRHPSNRVRAITFRWPGNKGFSDTNKSTNKVQNLSLTS